MWEWKYLKTRQMKERKSCVWGRNMASHNLFFLLHCFSDTYGMLVRIDISPWMKKQLLDKCVSKKTTEKQISDI